MSQRSSQRILFLNGLTDSEYDSDDENENNFTLRKKRRNIRSTSESEAEKDEKDDINCHTWTTKTFIPKIHQFTQEDSGIKKNITRLVKAIDYFELFVSEEVVQFIVTETNHY